MAAPSDSDYFEIRCKPLPRRPREPGDWNVDSTVGVLTSDFGRDESGCGALHMEGKKYDQTIYRTGANSGRPRIRNGERPGSNSGYDRRRARPFLRIRTSGDGWPRAGPAAWSAGTVEIGRA